MNRREEALLKELDACTEAVVWTKSVKTLREAWDTCPRSDWMLWALRRVEFRDDKKLRLYACKCVRGTPLGDGRTVWDLLTDDRSRRAVEVAERYAEGAASEEERIKAAVVAAAVVVAAADVVGGVAAAAREKARLWQAILLRKLISWDEVKAAIDKYKAGRK